MGFRTERESASRSDRSPSAVDSRYEAASSFDDDRYQQFRDDDGSPARREPTVSRQEAADLCGFDMYRDGQELQVQRLVDSHGAGKVRRWADEGMTPDTMGKPRSMEAFRERQKERPVEVPWDVERRNAMSVQRSRDAQFDSPKAGDTGVPDSVRDVVGSPGQQLDSGIQQAIEERMGDNLGDVRIHTGPQAAKACEDINARAFTVGNHVAFNTGEYDPESAEGQHVLAHELAHVRQQTEGAVSMLPQTGEGLEIDPDERLEREAEQTAERVMRGGAVGVPGMGDADVHVQRLSTDEVLPALAMFEIENEQGEVGDFQQEQNARRITRIRQALNGFKRRQKDLQSTKEEMDSDGIDDTYEVDKRLNDLKEALREDAEQIALTDEQRKKLDQGVDLGMLENVGSGLVGTLVGAVLQSPTAGFAAGLGTDYLLEKWGELDGDIEQRMKQLAHELEEDGVLTGEGDSTGDAQSRR